MYPNLYCVKFTRIPGVMDNSTLELLQSLCCRTELPGVTVPQFMSLWSAEFIVDEDLVAYQTFMKWALRHHSETGAATITTYNHAGDETFTIRLEDIRIEETWPISLDWEDSDQNGAKFQVSFRVRIEEEK